MCRLVKRASSGKSGKGRPKSATSAMSAKTARAAKRKSSTNGEVIDDDDDESEEEISPEEKQKNKARSLFKTLFNSKDPLAVFLRTVSEPTGVCVPVTLLFLHVASPHQLIASLHVQQSLVCFTLFPESPLLFMDTNNTPHHCTCAANFSTDMVDVDPLNTYYRMWLQYSHNKISRCMFLHEKKNEVSRGMGKDSRSQCRFGCQWMMIWRACTFFLGVTAPD